MHTDPQPIGIFDSGIGGLSLFKEIRALLPYEHLLYIADSAHIPYGNKSTDYIQQRALTLVDFLLQQQVKAVVVACNTATVSAITLLRQRYTLPIIGMEPAIKPAALMTRSGVVGVLATEGTLISQQFITLMTRFAHHVTVVSQPCHGLVEQVERGEIATQKTRALLERYIAPLLAAGADTIVLGCTHYPFLRPLIEELVGPERSIIDTGQAVAREVERRLAEISALITTPRLGQDHFCTSGDVVQAQAVIAQLYAPRVSVERLREPT